MINKKLKYSYLVTLLGLSTNSIALVVPGTNATIYYPSSDSFNIGSPSSFDTFKKYLIMYPQEKNALNHLTV